MTLEKPGIAALTVVVVMLSAVPVIAQVDLTVFLQRVGGNDNGASQEPVEPCPFLQDASTIAIVVARVTVVSIDDFVVAHTHGQPRKPVRLPYGLLPLVDRNGVDRLSAGVCALVGHGPGFSVG